MSRPRIAVIFTGGTISMRSSGAGNVPTLRGDELLATVPGLADLADVEPIDWGLVPASHLTFAQVLEIGEILARELARPDIDGAVVVQGTDVIEETAFAWDLLPLPPKPVVVVGAMRSASEPGYDGPANLRHALVAAADPALASQGVVVAMAGEVHAADDVRKTNSHALDTFQSPNAGSPRSGDRCRRHPRSLTDARPAASHSRGSRTAGADADRRARRPARDRDRSGRPRRRGRRRREHATRLPGACPGAHRAIDPGHADDPLSLRRGPSGLRLSRAARPSGGRRARSSPGPSPASRRGCSWRSASDPGSTSEGSPRSARRGTVG